MVTFAQMSTAEKKLSRLERYGMRYFSYLSRKVEVPDSGDEVHVLNQEEKKALYRVQRHSILRQAAAGAISAGLSVLVGFWLWPYPGDHLADLTWEEMLHYYALLYPLTFGITAVEILYLYYDGLRSVHKLSTIAGLNLFPRRGEQQGLSLYLVRAALELPNPPDGLDGINPRREISRFELLVVAAVYKFKATVTNFLVKAILRRIVGRSALRAVMEFAAMPVYGFWNGLIAYWVLRQARVRALGPSAIEEFSRVLYEDADQRSKAAQTAAFQAIGAAIVRTVDLHPNLILLMQSTRRHLGTPGEVPLDDSQAFIQTVQQLPPDEQAFALRVLVVASISDGKMVGRERRLLQEMFQRCGLGDDLSGIQRLRKAFVKGEDIRREDILNCLPAHLPA